MNILKKIFPDCENLKDFDKLKYDTEGLYSISLPNDAQLISLFIINNMVNNNGDYDNIKKYYTIVDGTAGIGGNTISFSKYFSKVISYEINKNRFNMLANNLKIYNLKNTEIYNCDSTIEFVNSHVYFFDPPWGGPEYKKTKNLKLKLSKNKLIDIINRIKSINNKAKICFKLPYNYDLNEFKNFTIKKMEIRNMILILIN